MKLLEGYFGTDLVILSLWEGDDVCPPHHSSNCTCNWPRPVRSRLRSRRAPGLKPDSTEEQPCIWTCFALNYTKWIKRPPAGVEIWRGVCQLRCRPRHLTAIQNDEVRSKITLISFKIGH
ncbi:hypothetical protein AVEN_155328-1 [Araneus ventricosus]|uniref:Uncharacterized protein n=1 Tax=Araneus ventricosus TaxID=182803 RepID=A0A4Y2JP47_ARAVE|nr:hypothetical protein AVEN_64160-1 [Araneus ventricosus]GBM90906.1 hypothetical protein AVEN_67110-1 [Araneus ventricosus]GBM90986.1 hypothetical protein AVEN_139380-1 [Araneus ventricosus]GBM91009.1 hypothetical protein AVEN_155328-1 [Araneus ventricosus]